MASLIPGYNYDIFISYRQKDNKGGRQRAPLSGATQFREAGWVSEFVEALKTELESTFKEEISVYFDINQHDGLLETHDVDASLKEKLKCLVFIPIISRTYCDPKSFAWEHEFKAFVEQASYDKFGLKIKLSNGNVASRVLPIQIHEISDDDKEHIERELGGILRPIEFTYKESGVNRPLRSYEDHPDNNLNKTYYRNQINKVANAIDKIINSLRSIPSASEKPQSTEPLSEVSEGKRMDMLGKLEKLTKRKLLVRGIVLAVLIIIAAIIVYPKIFKKNTLESLRSSGGRLSVAVMPFQNMTNDTTWNVWQDGIQNILITNLSNFGELKVRQRESVTSIFQSKGLTNHASITPSIAKNISQKLDANVFICGSIKESGTTIRLNAQLFDSKTEETFKSFQIDGTTENILIITDSLSAMVRNFLIISKLGKGISPDIQQLISTKSPEAYRYLIYGDNAAWKDDFSTAEKLYLQAIAIDSNFYYADVRLAILYWNFGKTEEGEKWLLRVYKKRDKTPMQLKLWIESIYAFYFETRYEVIKYLRQLQEIDDQSPTVHYTIGFSYFGLEQYDKAIPEFEKALEIYNKWGSKPLWFWNYHGLGFSYHMTGQYKKEKKLYNKAERDFPDNSYIISDQATLSLTEGDTVAANRYIEKYVSILKENSTSEDEIAYNVAGIYYGAHNFDKVEKYYRQILSLKPESPYWMNNLGWLLIETDRNINEGLELADKALKLMPDNWAFLDTKGWGLYKQGKYKEALEAFQKADSLKPGDHDVHLHLEAAKKAVANQKNN